MRTPDREECCTARSMQKGAVELKKCILGHTNIRLVSDMITTGKYGMKNSGKKKQAYETCMEANIKMFSSMGILIEGSGPINVHTDLCGKCRIKVLNGPNIL